MIFSYSHSETSKCTFDKGWRLHSLLYVKLVCTMKSRNNFVCTIKHGYSLQHYYMKVEVYYLTSMNLVECRLRSIDYRSRIEYAICEMASLVFNLRFFEGILSIPNFLVVWFTGYFDSCDIRPWLTGEEYKEIGFVCGGLDQWWLSHEGAGKEYSIG